MFDKEAYKKAVSKLTREQRAALAARNAMRVLPLLAVKQDFGYWPALSRAKHLLAILRASHTAILVSLGYTVTNATDAADAVHAIYAYAYIYANAYAALDATDITDITNAAYVYTDTAAYAHVYARARARADDDDIVDTDSAIASTVAYAVSYAVNAAAGDTYDAVNRSLSCLSAKNATQTLNAIILSDLVALKNGMATNALLSTPLWADQAIPAEINRYWQDFQRYAIALDAGFEVWLDDYAARLRGAALDENFLRNSGVIPEERLAQGPAAVNAYLKALREQRLAQALSMSRVIFIGNGGAGKTSLIRALNGLSLEDGELQPTPRVEISRWQGLSSETPADQPELEISFWDFGGQVVMHATHQFFLRERCLYVLVMSRRDDKDPEEQAQYWLEHVAKFGGNAPVMVVLNKTDQVETQLDQVGLKEKYPNILGFYPLSCSRYASNDKNGLYRAQFANFREIFSQQVQDAATARLELTAEEGAVKDQLLAAASQEHNYLEKDRFSAICDDCRFDPNPTARDTLLDLLDKLGVVVYFPNLSINTFILNPRWLTYGVYHVLHAEQAQKQQGKLSKSDICRILADSQLQDHTEHRLHYPEDKVRTLIIEAMKAFKLCYEVKGDANRLVIPELLSTEQPERLNFDKSQAMAFQFCFKTFLPRHILYAVMASHHEDIQQAWRHGAVLRDSGKDASALIAINYIRKRIDLYVTGSQGRDYFSALHRTFSATIGEIKGLEYTENVVCRAECRVGYTDADRLTRDADDQEQVVDFRQLLAHEQQGVETMITEHGNYRVSCLLNIMPKVDRADYARQIINIDNRTQNIFIQLLGNADTELLLNELVQLRSAMKKAAANSDDIEYDKAVGAIAAAEEAARQQDSSALLNHLKTAGRWALDTANKIGVNVAAKVLEQAILN